MSSISFQGPVKDRIASFAKLNRIILSVALRHAAGRKMAPDWDILTEVGIRFIREQFTYAMTCPSIDAGRQRFDSLLTKTDDTYHVTTREAFEPDALWFIPEHCDTDCVVLYCHGGGYTFRGPVTYRFAQMLAHRTRARVYMPLYRLTPEHPHPAQAEDAVAAWRALRSHTHANQIVVAGDSAGGHMALMLLQSLKNLGLEQPALCIGMSPWTDIGERGQSMTTNNPTDLVQGWMALQFGEWLDPDGTVGRHVLSPIDHDYTDLAPIYLQAGGREMMRDMIVEFAEIQAAKGVSVRLDLWNDMPHNFQAYDASKKSSSEALKCLRKAIHDATTGRHDLDLTVQQGTAGGVIRRFNQGTLGQ